MKQIKTTNMRENITIEQIIENINNGKTLLKGVLLTYKNNECLVSVKNYIEPSIFKKTGGYGATFDYVFEYDEKTNKKIYELFNNL